MFTDYADPGPDPRAEHYPTEARDGTPHLAYFAEGVSFVWSGNIEHPIQVCPGGYGEPVVDTIDFPRPQAVTWWVVLHEFRKACDRWLEARR